MVAEFTVITHAVVMDFARKEFASGNYYRCFTQVNYDFPVDGDAKESFGVFSAKNLDAPKSDIRAENKTTVRKLLKTWETNIDTDIRDVYFFSFDLSLFYLSI